MDFSQCTRKRKDNTEFCGSHIKNRPNGKIGDDGSCFHRKKGKRGRKRKNINSSANEHEILTTKIYIGNDLYLKDKHNIIIYEDVYKYLVYPKPEDEDEFNDEVEDDEIDMDMMEEFASLPGEVQRTIKSAVLPKYDRKKPEQSGNMLIFVVKAAVDNK